MKTSFIFAALLVMIFAGCSATEFNEGVDSVTGDISKVFEEGQDKSSD